MIHCHPSETLLLEYAAGNCSFPVAMSVAVHLQFCARCRTQMGALESLGGALLEKAEPVPVSPGLLANVLDSIEAPPAAAPAPQENTASGPLGWLLPGGLESADWRWRMPWLRVAHLPVASDTQVSLYRIRAGGRIPEHTHRGLEYTVVLRGGFSDSEGTYHEGDFIVRDGSHRHAPRALQNEECICLAVVDAPLHFTRGVMRWLNPLLAR